MKNLLVSAATTALAVHATGAQAQQVGQAQPALPKPAFSKVQSMQMALPLSRQGGVYGDVTAEVSTDGTIRYDRESLIAKISAFLTPAGQRQFAAALPATPFVTPAEVELAGVTLVYDSSRLEVRVDRIDPKIVKAQMIGDVSPTSTPPITMKPQEFSAYLNMIGDLRMQDFNDFQSPAVILQGAIRYKGVVLEADGGYDETLTGTGSGFYRRQARLVYDEYDKLRRWTAGDLQVNGLSITSGTLLGGFAVEKGRRVFVGSSPLINLGGQQFLLDRDATLDVVVDGQQAERLQLNAGSYDLSRLMAQYGGRNAQLFVTDTSGRRQVTGFDPYYDPSNLVAGESEYGAAVGFVPREFRAQPIYSSDPGFSGYYRRGLTNRFQVGLSVQASQDVQVAAAETILAPRIFPGRVELSSAVSTGGGTGYSFHGAVVLQKGYGLSAKQFAVSADYRSHNFQTLSDQIGLNRFQQFSLTANYSQALSERTTLVVGGNWFERENLRTTKLAFVDVMHRTPRFRLTAGAEYGYDTFGRRYGARVSLVVPLGRNTRVESAYNSRRDDTRVTLTRSYDDTIGSFGYDLGFRRSQGNYNALEGSANYTGNRFYARFTTTSAGNGFSGITDRQDSRLQIGTSIAYTGGSVAIGKPVDDSFVIAKPHEALEGKQVIVGQSVDSDRVQAESGTFGPALDGNLSSYNRQSFQYDLKGGTGGYDIGTGIQTVLPPYKSGYKMVVGSDASVSAYGFLDVAGQRANLLSGMISGVDDPDFETQVFFTNSVGRFAAQGLRPGKTYRVRLKDQAGEFLIKVPAGTKSLLQMGEVNARIVAEGQE